MMDIDKKLELLKKIQPEEAPPFLYTRILASLESRSFQPAPISWKLAFAAVLGLIIALNISVFFKSASPQVQNPMEEVANVMQLSTSNELYHD